MLVDITMVRELIDGLLSDQPFLGFEVKLRRQDSMNTEAKKISESYRKEDYEGKTLTDLLLYGINIYNDLHSKGIILNDDMMKEHAWLRKYLPIFDSEMFSRMLDKYKSEYNYSDMDEASLQSATAFMLAYHSNPTLFIQKPDEFEALANIWSEALLTFNCRKMPMFALNVKGWHDQPYYSIERNLVFFGICAEQFLRIAQNFKAFNGLSKWHKRIVEFDAILKVLPFVIEDYKKIHSHKFVDAIRHCEYLKEHAAELQAAPALPEYLPVQEETTNIATAAQNVPPVYLTPEKQVLNDAGMQLIQNGVRNLIFAQSLPKQQFQDHEEVSKVSKKSSCCLQ